MNPSPISVRRCTDDLKNWAIHADPPTFPYAPVIACIRESGKHFASPLLLNVLATVRARLDSRGNAEGGVLLRGFLDNTLDKHDDKHHYQSYTGISLLGLTADADGRTARDERNEWLGLLLADLWTFEAAARDGAVGWLPRLRPGADLCATRLHLLAGLLSRMVGPGLPDSPAERARAMLDAAGPDRLLRLSLCMQPVYVMHDECLFIRVLQSFEVTFAAMSGHMRDAIVAMGEDRPADAAEDIRECISDLLRARPLFTLLATMRTESFRTFRAFTVGASAIQSGNYKIFEALCSAPAAERLDSAAFDNVPDIQQRVRAGLPDFTSAVHDATSRGALRRPDIDALHAAVRQLEDAHQRWKQTHWKLAVRMIGADTGTGYTAGVPYLREVINNRLFTRLLPVAAGGHA